MYKWKLEYFLKNGVFLEGMYEGPENNTHDVLNRLYAVPMNELVPTYGEDKTKVIAVMMSEIAAIRITPA